MTTTISPSDTGQSVTVRSITASETLDRNDCPILINNTGAAGTLTLTLPQNAKGGEEVFVYTTVAQVINVAPGAAGAVYIEAAKQTDDKDVILSAAIGNSVKFVADGNGDWIATIYSPAEALITIEA